MRALKLILAGLLLLAIPASASAAESHWLSRVSTSQMGKNSTAVIGSYAYEAFHPEAGSNVTFILQIDLRTHRTTRIHTLDPGNLQSIGASSGRLMVISQETGATGDTKIAIYTIAPDGTDRRAIATSSYVGARACGSEIKNAKPLAAGQIALQITSFGTKTPGGDACQTVDPAAPPARTNNVELRDQFGRLVETRAMPESFSIDDTTFDKAARYYASFGDSVWQINPFLGGNSQRYRRDNNLDYVIEGGPNHALWVFSNGGGRTSGHLRFYSNPQQNARNTVIAKRLPRRAFVSFCGNDVWFVAKDSKTIKKFSPRNGKVSTVVKTPFRISNFRCSSSAGVVWEAGSADGASSRGFALIPR